MAQGSITDEELAALIRCTEEANAAFMRGDMLRYATLITHSDDYTLMAPFGGAPTRGFDDSSERLAELARYFRAGSRACTAAISAARSGSASASSVSREDSKADQTRMGPLDWCSACSNASANAGRGSLRVSARNSWWVARPSVSARWNDHWKGTCWYGRVPA